VVTDVSTVCGKDLFYRRSSTFRTEGRTGTKTRTWTSKTVMSTTKRLQLQTAFLPIKGARTHASHAFSVNWGC